MLNISEKFTAAGKHSLQAQMALLHQLGDKVFESSQKLLALNVQISKTLLADGKQSASQLLHSKHPLDFWTNQSSHLKPAMDHILSYETQLAQLFTEAQTELLSYSFKEAVSLQDGLMNLGSQVHDSSVVKTAAPPAKSTVEKPTTAATPATPAKAAAKPVKAESKPVKAAEKPAAKAKPSPKAAAKTVSKAPVKVEAKVPAKAPVKAAEKAVASVVAKTLEKTLEKTNSKPVKATTAAAAAKPAKASKPANASKTTKAGKPVQPAAKEPAQASPVSIKAIPATPAPAQAPAPAAVKAMAPVEALSAATPANASARPPMPRPHLVSEAAPEIKEAI